MTFEILYEDRDWVAINKPSGLMVHPTELCPSDTQSVMHLLRDQLGQWVYPIHRLDRGVSGVLLFARNPEAARWGGIMMQDRNVTKEYEALVRGFVPESGEMNRPLAKNNNGKKGRRKVESVPVPSHTRFTRVSRFVHDKPVGRYSSARASFVKVEIFTGRYHQIRRHFSGISHPVIGDFQHGDRDHNRFYESEFQMRGIWLHSKRLTFRSLGNGDIIEVCAAWPTEKWKWLKAWSVANLKTSC